MKKMLLIGAAALASVAVFFLGAAFGRLDAQIRTGSPAYFTIQEIHERLLKSDGRLEGDLQVLLDRMDPKNASGVNGDAMELFLRARAHSAENSQRTHP